VERKGDDFEGIGKKAGQQVKYQVKPSTQYK
jgi:hypothetical protein